MTLSSRTRTTLRDYWSHRLGVEKTAFDSSGVSVGVAEEGGVQLFRSGDSLVVGAPESLADELRQRATALKSLDCTNSQSVRTWFAQFGTVAAVLGPTFYGYTDDESFDPLPSDARLLTVGDEPAYDRFRATIPEEEWSNGGTPFTPGETVGLFQGDDLVALSGYEVWDDFIAHVAVVAHPDDHRGDGNGRAVVSRMTEHALTAGLVPQYRTVDAWPWSVALAEGLGFERFATAMLVYFE